MADIHCIVKNPAALLAAGLMALGLASAPAYAQSAEAKALMQEGYAALRRGDKVAMNEAFEKSCAADAGSSGCISAGQNFGTGYGVARDVPRAVQLLERACAAGHERGCSSLARLRLESGAAPADAAQSLAVLRTACSADPPEDASCVALGKAHAAGLGVAQDRQEAMRLFEASCRPNHAYSHYGSACFEAGKLYLTGAGASYPKDNTKALPRLKLGCELKVPGACELMATLQPVATQAAPQVATAAPAAKPAAAAPAATGLADRCNAGDAYACETHAWNLGNSGNWRLASQFAGKGCRAGRASSCSAASIYDNNFRNHGDQSGAGLQAQREGIVARARQWGTYSQAISSQLRNQRDLATVAELISWGGADALRKLTLDEMADLAGQPWEPTYRISGAYVLAEWRRRDGPGQLAALRRSRDDAARQQAKATSFKGVGENENGIASCSAKGRPGTRYQYSGPDGYMVYGPCTAL